MVRDRGCAEEGDRRTDVAHAVDTECKALPLAPVPAGDERHTDRERRARHAEQEPDRDQRPVRMGIAEEHRRECRDGQQQREHQPAAVAVGQNAERDAQQRPEHDRHRRQQQRLGVRQTELGLERLRERRDQTPGREAERERDGRKNEIARRRPRGLGGAAGEARWGVTLATH